MRATRVVVVAAIAGTLLGVGIVWANFRNVPALLVPNAAVLALAPAGQAQPKVLLEEEVFDFGPVDRDSKAHHAFKFTNGGAGVLTLKAGPTSCSACTIAELSQEELGPGESAYVTIEYSPASSKPRILQEATILTNDPERPRVTLKIVGHVTSRYRVEPGNWSFSKISADETKTVAIRVYAYLSQHVELLKHEFSGAESAANFEVQSAPIAPDKLGDPDALGGCIVSVTIKPGLPLGPIRQTIRLTLEIDDGAEPVTVEVPVEGKVDSDISVAGPGWNGDTGVLDWGWVKAKQGAQRELLLLVRGSHRNDLKITPGKIQPDWLKVSVGAPKELESRSITQIPLLLEVPRGSTSANHLGSGQGKFGEIILETTHPQVKQVRLYVRFAVEP